MFYLSGTHAKSDKQCKIRQQTLVYTCYNCEEQIVLQIMSEYFFSIET